MSEGSVEPLERVVLPLRFQAKFRPRSADFDLT
jgi:hypothetical protein